MVLGEVRFSRRALADDQRLAVQLRNVGDQRAVGRNHSQRNFHIRQREINHFGALRRDGKVRKDNIHLRGGQIFDAVRRVHGDELELRAQIFRQPAGEIYVVALIIAVFIDIAEGLLVGEHADDQLAAFFDFIQRAGGGSGEGRRNGQKRKCKNECKNLHELFHIQNPSFCFFEVFMALSSLGVDTRLSPGWGSACVSSFLFPFRKQSKNGMNVAVHPVCAFVFTALRRYAKKPG